MGMNGRSTRALFTIGHSLRSAVRVRDAQASAQPKPVAAQFPHRLIESDL
jgi:hypothetical protein